MKQLDKIYIIHYTKLTDRKKYLDDKLGKINVEVEWVTHLDRETVTQEQIDKFYKFDPLYKDIHIDPVTGEPPIRHLRLQEICANMAHDYCITQQVENGYEFILVLEDDILFEDYAFESVNNLLNILPNDCDICYFGNGCNLKPTEVVPNKIFYETNFGVKAADSILYTLKSSKFLYKKHMHRPIDYHINTFREDLKIYWVEPPIFFQGSQNETYKTSMQLFDRNWIV